MWRSTWVIFDLWFSIFLNFVFVFCFFWFTDFTSLFFCLFTKFWFASIVFKFLDYIHIFQQNYVLIFFFLDFVVHVFFDFIFLFFVFVFVFVCYFYSKPIIFFNFTFLTRALRQISMVFCFFALFCFILLLCSCLFVLFCLSAFDCYDVCQ